MKAITIKSLGELKARGEKIVALTCYDAGFVPSLEAADIDVILVGDSLGMVIQGHSTTLPVTLEQMVYHSSCVARVRRKAFLVVDLPFLSFIDIPSALKAAAALMKEGGAQMVKLEGGHSQLAVVSALAGHGVPVCAHLGLQPQLVHQLGGYLRQGTDPVSAGRILSDARALQEAGAQMLVLECVPSELAQEVSLALEIPVIGIGAGPGCDGQILVLHDILGLTARPPAFARNFMQGAGSIGEAIASYSKAVRELRFPA
jgi:3-methyl-2-oxobutanoate hydroxymethyltransferase